jgi:actin-related protein
MKETLTYVARDFDAEMMKGPRFVEKSYELPDGNAVTVAHERFACPEALFQPSLAGIRAVGIHTVPSHQPSFFPFLP